MAVEKIDEEKQIAQCKATLMKELKAVYKELQKDKDWEKFGKQVKNIYLSYTTCDNEVYHKAMRDVLAGAIREELPADLIEGNYGLRTQAGICACDDIKMLQDMKERYGIHVMKRHMESFNECQAYALLMTIEEKKQVRKMYDDLVKTMVNISNV